MQSYAEYVQSNKSDILENKDIQRYLGQLINNREKDKTTFKQYTFGTITSVLINYGNDLFIRAKNKSFKT